MYKIEAPYEKLNFFSSLYINISQTSVCTLKSFNTQSIKNDKSFSKQISIDCIISQQ